MLNVNEIPWYTNRHETYTRAKKKKIVILIDLPIVAKIKTTDFGNYLFLAWPRLGVASCTENKLF